MVYIIITLQELELHILKTIFLLPMELLLLLILVQTQLEM